MAIERKDYGANAVIPASNEVVKRVNTQNSPYSVQAIGLDKQPDKHILVTADNIQALQEGVFVNQGNVLKRISNVTTSGIDPDIVVESVDLIHKDIVTGEEVTETVTAEEILASSNIFLGETD